MTFEEWWEDFVAEHDDWKYADSEALRRAAFQAGAASRDAEVAELNRRIEYWRNTARKYLVPETQVRKP